MPDTKSDHEVQVVEVSREEGREMLDRAARGALNISADEFLAKWDAGVELDVTGACPGAAPVPGPGSRASSRKVQT